MPHLAKLAARGEVGRAATIPAGMPPGSDVGNLSILGYDPAVHHTGRAPIEAAAMGLRLRPDQIAYRCNLATVGDDGTMVDFAGGHPSTEEAAAVIATLQAELGDDEIDVPPGRAVPPHPRHPRHVGRRRLLPAPRPHRQARGVAHRPRRPRAAGAHGRLAGRSSAPPTCKANQIWLWGQGPQPVLPSFESAYGLEAGLVVGRRPHPGPRRPHRHPRGRGRGHHRLVRHQLRGQARRLPGRPRRRRRPLPHPRGGQRRGRPRRQPGGQGRGPGELGPPHHRPPRRGPRRPGPVADAPPARPPHAAAPCAPTRPTPCPTCSSTPPSTAPAAPTTKRHRLRATRARPPAHEPPGRSRPNV